MMSLAPSEIRFSPRTAPGQLWLLVEFEGIGQRKDYAVIDANDVIGYMNCENMHTGKKVYIRRGKISLKATIVIISDDKDFVNTELLEVKRNTIPENNKRAAIAESSISEVDDSSETRKRSRLSNDNSRDESPVWGEPGIVTTTAVASTTTAAVKPIAIEKKYIPPMTFDQQTQTDGRNSSLGSGDFVNISQFMQLREILVNEIRTVRMESRQSNEELSNMLRNVQRSLSELSEKIDNLSQHLDRRTPHTSNHDDTIEYKIFATNDHEITLEQVGSKCQIENIPSPHHTVIESSVGGLSRAGSSVTLNTSGGNSSANSSIVMDMIRSDWPEYEGNEGMIPIGNNKTLVPATVLESINWKTPSAATRKLLTTIFSRETLSTHTLTGKPSPAFHDRHKPLKNQLDPIKVADIIQIVSKYCKVPETMVRSAITTKCADENKMSRQRTEKRRRTLAEQNKENISNHLEII